MKRFCLVKRCKCIREDARIKPDDQLYAAFDKTNHHLIVEKDLHPSRSNICIKVRVLRAWNRMSFKNASEVYALEMLLADEQGTRRQSTCMNTYLRRFSPMLQEGKSLIIKNPALGDNPAQFKYVDCPFKICFFYDTTVTECEDFIGSPHGFFFTSFTDIINRTFENKQPIDVIGDVTCCYDMESFTSKAGKDSSKRTMQLEDKEGNKIYLTLWDEYALQFNEYVEQHKEVNRLVIILQFGRLSYFKDKPYISNNFTVTRLFINDHEKTNPEFKISQLPADSSNESRGTNSSLFCSFRDDFLLNTKFLKIVEVNGVDKPQNAVIRATVNCVVPEIPWFYDACARCNFKVTLQKELIKMKLGEEKVWFCNSAGCEGQEISAVQRFKIPFRVTDATGMVTLAMFEREATRLFRKSATTMYNTYLNGGYEGFIPSEFNVLFGKTFAFKIDITKYNIEYGYPLYTILKYSDDMVIVTELEDRFVDDNAADTPSDNKHSNYFPEEVTPSNTEKTSVIDESNTQNVSVDKSFGKRIMMEDNDEVPVDGRIVLKRNQKEVYDLEENEESWVTKSRTNVDDGQFDSGKFLLTPKEEKII